MQIAALHVSNFIGARAVDIRAKKRVQLIAGLNGAGKTSLRDAVALALTADLSRVTLKKEAPELISDGADLAVAELTDADGDIFKVTINRSGKINNSRERFQADPVLPYVLDAQRLARLDPVERRAFLFGLMGLKTDGPAIVERLLARGLAPKRIERVQPLLRAGFDAACKEAKAKATEAKGAWKAVTLETYGSEKAKTWRATVPPHDPALAQGLARELQHCELALDSWQRTIGGLEAEDARRQKLRDALPPLQQLAALEQRRRDKLTTDEATLADTERALAAAAEAAGQKPRTGLVHDLAIALQTLLGDYFPEGEHGAPSVNAARAALAAYVKQHGELGTGVGDPAAAARLPELRHAAGVSSSAVANATRDLQEALNAKTEHARITAELAQPFDTAALADARQQIETLKAQRATTTAKIEEQRSIKALVEGAEAKTKQAAGHAADVAGWDALGDALAPDGIPGEMLAEALGPINDRLAQSAADTDWPVVVIAADMAITAGGRAYRLLSESEKWRVDAVLAEAVAHLSGAGLLVLDRFDVLDVPGRAQMLGWIDVLAELGEIDTALIFATLKALPSELPASVQAHWIESGVVGQLKAAA